jgi:hypothetical protein
MRFAVSRVGRDLKQWLAGALFVRAISLQIGEAPQDVSDHASACTWTLFDNHHTCAMLLNREPYMFGSNFAVLVIPLRCLMGI